jgi:hypothetical protein
MEYLNSFIDWLFRNKRLMFGVALLLIGLRNLLNGGFFVAALLAASWFIEPDSRPYILELKNDAIALLSFYFGI